MTVATTTTIARTAPRIAERTGTARLSRPGIEREADACDAGDRQARSRGHGRDARSTSGDRARRAGPTRCGACRYASTTAVAHSTTSRPATPTPSTVQSNAMPAMRIHAAAPVRAVTAATDATATAAASNAPSDDRTDDADQPVGHRHGRARAQRAQRVEVVGAGAELAADRLTGDRAARPARRSHRTRRARSIAARWPARRSPPRPR